MASHTATTPSTIDVHTVYLEMLAHPQGPANNAPAADLHIRRAKAPMFLFYRYLYDTVGEPWLWYDRRRLSRPDLEAIIHDPLVEVWVIFKAGTPAGFAELDRRNGIDVELKYFGLIPDFIGHGIGPYFLDWVVRTAWQGGSHKVTVNTCNFDHPKALRMYMEKGFIQVRTESKAVADPRNSSAIVRPVPELYYNS